jgi:hypothetical protein
VNSESKLHDAAWDTSMEVLNIVIPILRPEEVRDCFEAIYECVKTGMRAYHGKLLWLANRIPSNN